MKYVIPAASKKWWRKVLVYRCRLCWLPFPRFGQLLSHTNRHCSRGPHGCVECQKIFHSYFICQLHRHFFHGKQKPCIGGVYDPRFVFHSELKNCFKWQMSRERSSSDGQSVVIGAQKLHMKETRKQFAAAPQSAKHSCQTACKNRCAVGHAAKNINGLTNRNVGLSEANTYSCLDCLQTFPVLRQLKLHMRTHDDLRPFKCMQCDKQFKQKAHLVQHVQTLHEGERPHSCSECGKTFKRRSHLMEHHLTHTTDKCFQCDVCGLRFARRFQLRAHRKV